MAPLDAAVVKTITSTEGAVILVGMSTGALNWIASVSCGDRLPVLDRLVTVILLGCCIFVILAILQKAQEIFKEAIAMSGSAEGLLNGSGKTGAVLAQSAAVDLETLAIAMQGPRGVERKDRRYRLSNYPDCFVGSEAVDWLVQQLNCTREQAVAFGQALLEQEVIRHVAEAHPFRDDYLFYRFNPRQQLDSVATTDGVEEELTVTDIEPLVTQMRESGGLEIQNRRYRLTIYLNCFVGSEAVDWLVQHQDCTREEAVALGQILLNRGIIHHVMDEHPFKDEYLFYRFYIDEP